ncbi:DNase I-like protein [Trichodelitschia bisporula]|uniref:DNase I-like protein n=1 Tax=Trichodelitschia bisporula TaxID=703511 RepID=A0A6G1I7T7_9PEZI|nr:DNase I-like protein [Trichodelitschia bisporula]
MPSSPKSSRPSSPTSSLESLTSNIPGAYPFDTSTAASLSAAVHARRRSYTRQTPFRVKIGTWNVAAMRGAERDIGAWFVHAQGVAEGLSGVDRGAPEGRESVEEQELRRVRSKTETSVPLGDEGAMPRGEEVGMYVLGLQEVVDIASPTEALKPFTDPMPAGRFKAALAEALPDGYTLVAEQQLIGLLLLIYAAPDVAAQVRGVSTCCAGTGLFGYMGNKGAVAARLMLGETTCLVFVNCHLAAGADKTSLDRRNWDAAQVVARTKFERLDEEMGMPRGFGETLGDEDYAFWFGDLNYRLEGIPGDDVRRLLTLHTKNEYKVPQKADDKAQTAADGSGVETTKLEQAENAVTGLLTLGRNSGNGIINAVTGSSTNSGIKDGSDTASVASEDDIPASMDPTSLHTTLASLLPHDELHQQMRARKAFHDGWSEGEIKFPPTYKYDVGKVAVFDSSDKKRSPSWCDRILYRTRAAHVRYKVKLAEEEAAKKRDEEMKARGVDEAAADENVLFDYEPTSDDDFASAPEDAASASDDASLDLECYTAHQRVLTSDHKPLDAVFRLTYDAVVPDLKSQITKAVARELDRAENEARPSVTVIVDSHAGDESTDSDAEVAGVGVGRGVVDGVVHFGRLRYKGRRKARMVTIANTGRVKARVGFVDRPGAEDGGATPEWLGVQVHATPDASEKGKKQPTYTIEPGEVCEVELTARVEGVETVKKLNEGVVKLDDVLILRVEGGRDHFLPVQGEWGWAYTMEDGFLRLSSLD